MEESDKIRERIKFVLKQNRFGVTALADGDSALQSKLSRQINNGAALTTEVISLVLKKFPSVSAEWLLFGNGSVEMDGERVSEQPQANLIPLVPLAAIGGALSDFTEAIHEYDCEKIPSPVKMAELAIPVKGESMSPRYPNGSIVFVRKVASPAFVEWGEPHVLNTRNGVVIKLLAPSDKENCVKCVSINPNPMYAPFDVPSDDIFSVYRVIGCLSY